ncbi:MAG: LON peptidase substrate-binding domain-containing protein [Acidobacteriota bacterium]|jgi:Lon protease-like protein|nr:LON peptidase substrate-binding domain-containing protein [Acidobacteriota bacterium]
MIVPLFSLPDVVLFPKTPVPLCVFEERYRKLVEDAIAGSRELVVALLRDESESGYTGLGDVCEVGCLGRIESCEEQEDGKYDIVVAGLRRVRIVREARPFPGLPRPPYPLVEVETLDDVPRGDFSDELIVRHNMISGSFARFVDLATGEGKSAHELMPQMEFNSLINTVAMTLNITLEQKQDLLEMDDPFQRCDSLVAILEQQIEMLEIVRRFEHLKPERPHFN